MNKLALGGLLATSALVAYYMVKPLLPQRIRYLMRRLVAMRLRRKAAAVWPVLPGSEAKPKGWSGWPGGAKFAVVLTHDVEGQRGLDKCRDLMKLEMDCGFRSCFYFIPEGEYELTESLRDELVGNGFEVAVHDLKHDGKLYQSEANFRAGAERINHYVKTWGAQGFRAGFMRHNLQWQLALDVQHDASTFDVDPFEPQPDGAGTIFPFVVDGTHSGHPGYVELPYTLVQDSTLFLFLRERSIDIWKQKLDWIAQHGGMVMLITHPDYMDFSGGTPPWNEYSAARYRELMDYIATRYAGQYWHALPQEVARHCRSVWPAGSTGG